MVLHTDCKSVDLGFDPLLALCINKRIGNNPDNSQYIDFPEPIRVKGVRDIVQW